MPPDISAAATILILGILLFFLAGGELIQIFWVLVGGLIVGYLVVQSQPTANIRVAEYLAGFNDPMQASDHVRRAIEAFVSGGMFGVGIGNGVIKLTRLPVPPSDSIFAVIGEELGFVGCMGVIGLFVLLTWRGFKIAMGTSDAFSALVACGVTCGLAFQALVNVAVMTALIPFTGVALPFISAGGSAMVVSLAGVGLLLSVSRGKRTGKRSKRGLGQPVRGLGKSVRGLGKSKGRKESRRRANLDRRWRNGGTRLSRSGRRTGTGR